MNLLKQRLIVQQADEEHRAHPRRNPIDLLDMSARKLGVFGGTVNLQHTKCADHQYEAQKDPIEITVGNVARHDSVANPGAHWQELIGRKPWDENRYKNSFQEKSLTDSDPA